MSDYDTEVMMVSKRFLTFLAILFAFVQFPAFAGDPVSVWSRKIDVSQSKITIYAQESKMFGITCKSGPVGDLKGLRTIGIGDTINFGKYSFRVGVIQATLFSEDSVVDGEVLARRGEIVCLVASNKAALPTLDDCDGLWLRVRNCKHLF